MGAFSLKGLCARLHRVNENMANGRPVRLRHMALD